MLDTSDRSWRLPVVVLSTLLLEVIPALAPARAQADAVPRKTIQLLTPAEGLEVLGRRPLIRFRVAASPPPGALLVLLDGTDITDLLDRAADSYSYSPIQILSAGRHQLLVLAQLVDGREISSEFTFSTRHTRPFREVYSDNRVSAIYEASVERPDNSAETPHWKVETNLESRNRASSEFWELFFNTNLRYRAQDLPVFAPDRKGASLVDYLASARFQGDRGRFGVELGDVRISETRNTVWDLARRGGTLAAGFDDVDLRAFVMSSQKFYAKEGETGLEGDADDHLVGTSAKIGLFSDQLRLRALYATGGEPGSSFGIETTDGARRGDVWGFTVDADLFEQRVGVTAEFDFSDFDEDTADEFDSEKDSARRFTAEAQFGAYRLEGSYEWFGPDYAVVGNPALRRDAVVHSLLASARPGNHSFDGWLSYSHDNVEDDALVPKIHTSEGYLSYGFQGLDNLFFGMRYARYYTRSSDEPEFTPSTKTMTDDVSGNVSYQLRRWMFGLQGGYSQADDRTDDDLDTSTLTITFNPSYTGERIFGSAGLSWNRSSFSAFEVSDVATDTITLNLDLRGEVAGGIFYDLAGTITSTEADDQSTDRDDYQTGFRLGWRTERIWGFLDPEFGVRGTYNRSVDHAVDESTEEFTLFFVTTGSFGLTF